MGFTFMGGGESDKTLYTRVPYKERKRDGKDINNWVKKGIPGRNETLIYNMSKKSWPILCSKLLYEMGKEFLEYSYRLSGEH